jgi:hypothetical protein
VLKQGAAVMMQPWSEYSALFVELARQLKREHGCRIHLYVSIDRDVRHYSKIDDGKLFESVNLVGEIAVQSLGPTPPHDQVVAEARENEKWLGLTYNELAVSNRHLGRGFALGGFYHPRSRLSENIDYWTMLHIFNGNIAYWRREIEQKRPVMAIQMRKHCAVVARKMGVPMRWLAIARFKNYYHWTHTEFAELPTLERTYRRIREALPAELDAPYKAHMDLREVFRKRASLWRTCAHAGYVFAQRVYWWLRGYQKGRSYYIRGHVATIFRNRSQLRETTGRNAVQLEALAGQRFVFFPLHTEPEEALQGYSPEYFYQLSCIAALARDLPAGVVLAVKDTYAGVGRRPDNFYDQIRAFKNVVLLDTMTVGPDVIRASAAVATITGTAGFEAVVMGKPVVTFGHHNLYNFLPHVRFIDNERDLKPALAELLDESFDREAACLAGGRFLAAVTEESFDLGSFDLRKRGQIAPEQAKAAYDSLIASLSPVTPALKDTVNA